MNVVLTINDDYAFGASVMLTSLFENNCTEKHAVFLFYSKDRLSLKNIEQIQNVIQKYGHVLYCKAVDKNIFKDYKVDHHFSVEAYYRFLIQSLLPDQESRAIYLEADQIIQSDISSFYYSDLSENAVAVCRSINKNPGELIKKLHLPENTVYFNSGVILYDLKKLRKMVSQKEYFDYLDTFSDRVTWMDQDVLNVIYSKIKNVVDYKLYNFQIFPKTKVTKTDFSFVLDNTKILHYIGSIKPWSLDYQGEFLPCYLRYEKIALGSWNYYIKRLKRFISGVSFFKKK